METVACGCTHAAAQPPFALGRGALQIGQHHVHQGLPRNNAGELEQRMGG